MSDRILFGNYPLTKPGLTVSRANFNRTPVNSVQTFNITGANGVIPVSTNQGGKAIELTNCTIDVNATDEYSDLDDFRADLSGGITRYDGSLRLLRRIRSADFTTIIDPTDTGLTINTGGGDQINVAKSSAYAGNSDQIRLFDKAQSVMFDIDVSASANNRADFAMNASSATDLSDFVDGSTKTGTFHLGLYIPDVKDVTSLFLEVGNDNDNYYRATITTNWEGQPFENGYNIVAAEWDDMTETGTVDNTTIQRYEFSLNYTSEAEDQDGCAVGFMAFINEPHTRNYSVIRQDGIGVQGANFNITHDQWDLSLLNNTGFSQSIFTTNIINETGVVSNTIVKKFDLEGSTTMFPEFDITINDATDVSGIKITDLATDRFIELDATGFTFTAGDRFTFGGLGKGNIPDIRLKQNGEPVQPKDGLTPEFLPGVSRVEINVQATDAEDSVPSTLPTDNTTADNDATQTSSDQVAYIAQAFTLPASTTISLDNVDLWVHSFSQSFGASQANIGFNWYLMSDSSGDPGSILEQGTFSPSTGLNTINITYGVSGSTTYHFVARSSYEGDTSQAYTFGRPVVDLDLDADTNTSAITGDCNFSGSVSALTNPDSGSITWTAQSLDLKFQADYTADPNIDYDVTANNTVLHSN